MARLQSVLHKPHSLRPRAECLTGNGFPCQQKGVTKPNLSPTEKPLRFDRMSGLNSEQRDELEDRVTGLLGNPWDSGTGRPRELTLREAIIVSSGYMRPAAMHRWAGEALRASPGHDRRRRCCSVRVPQKPLRILHQRCLAHAVGGSPRAVFAGHTCLDGGADPGWRRHPHLTGIAPCAPRPQMTKTTG